MKLRISESSLRFRLTQTEAAQLLQGCAICHEVSFAPRVFLRFLLVPSAEAGAFLNENSIIIKIAHKDCKFGPGGVTYGFENGTSEKLCVMIEKDDPSQCAKSHLE